MERRSFLKGLFGTAAAVAIPTTIVNAQQISKNETLNDLWQAYCSNIDRAISLNDVTIIDKELSSKVNKELSLLSFDDIKNYTNAEDFDAWYWASSSLIYHFMLINQPFDARNTKKYIEKVLRYHTKHNKTVWWYQYSYPHSILNTMNREIERTKKIIGNNYEYIL